ncbi:hypothetical protein [Streptomyces mirabilis]|uniref:hypothetical protein n=1 Tax=Streptomyces mirabilis TaxID=68239 RepID=UPI0036D029AC
MLEIALRAPNPYDFTPQELEEIVSLLREDPELQVTVDVQPERGYGVTPIEVVVLVFVGKAVASGALAYGGEVAVKKAVGWARDRWRREREEQPELPPRPRRIQILYGPDDQVLREIAIDLPDGEPQETQPDSGT